jgi:hypothetical protein
VRAVPLIFCIAGCGLSAGEKTAVGSFGSSVSSFGTVAGQQLPAMRDGSVAMTEAAYTADPATKWPDTAHIGTAGYEAIMYGKFTPERVAQRQQAITVLVDYGTALTALAGYDASKDLATSSAALGTAIKGLPKQDKVISDADADVLAQIVQQLGGLLVDYEKARAVRRIVPIYQPQVDKLCTLLADDFDSKQPELANVYEGQAASLREHEIIRLNTNGQSMAVRAQALPALELADSNYRRARQVLPGVADAGRKCVTASDNLAKAVASPSYSLADIEAFSQAVFQLEQTAAAWK